ncbi:MAG: DUF4856 domain-containing protein [Oligoflexus sp.]
MKQKIKSLFVYGMYTSLVLTAACGDDEKKEEPVATQQDSGTLSAAKQILAELSPEQKALLDAAPSVYEFERDGQSTVSYDGQIFRQILIEDLKTYIGNLQRGTFQGAASDVVAALDSYYSYSFDRVITNDQGINGSSLFAVSPKNLEGNAASIAEGTSYNDIQDNGKNLRDKTAGNDNPLLREGLKGWNTNEVHGYDLTTIDADGNGDAFVEPEDLLELWFRIIGDQAADGQSFVVSNGDQAEQSISEAYITEDGLDLNQLIQKFLHASVSFSQTTGDYLSSELGEGKGLLVDNEGPAKAGVTYTALEHHWDEGFGYFGAARNYLDYTDKQIADGVSIDSNSDGNISLLTEKNFGISVNAAKRDLAASDGAIDLSSEGMKAFLQGRQLITQKPEGYLPVVQALSIVIADNWERSLASTVIHYINKLSAEMDQYGTADYLYKDHVKYFAEMKGFALAFQFNPYSAMSAEQFDRFHELVADKPVLMQADEASITAYKAALLEARQILQDVYGFSSENVANW